MAQARVLDQLPHLMGVQIPIPLDRITDFCRRWKIDEFSLFGSVLRSDFSDTSDVDVLIAFARGTVWDFDHYDAMETELRVMFGREVDMVERRLLRNPFRRYEILTNRQVIYTANSPTDSSAAVPSDPRPGGPTNVAGGEASESSSERNPR